MALNKVNNTNFKSMVLENPKPVLVDFYADWCGPCKMMAPVIEELSEEISDVAFAKLNVDNNSDIAGQFGIMSIPTLILFENSAKKMAK